MEKKTPDEEEYEEIENFKFGYIPSIIFLIFIGFVIYISVTK